LENYGEFYIALLRHLSFEERMKQLCRIFLYDRFLAGRYIRTKDDDSSIVM